MAKLLTDYFNRAKEMGGIQGVVKLAMISKISSKAAETLPDSPENLKKMELGFAEVKKALGK